MERLPRQDRVTIDDNGPIYIFPPRDVKPCWEGVAAQAHLEHLLETLVNRQAGIKRLRLPLCSKGDVLGKVFASKDERSRRFLQGLEELSLSKAREGHTRRWNRCTYVPTVLQGASNIRRLELMEGHFPGPVIETVTFPNLKVFIKQSMSLVEPGVDCNDDQHLVRFVVRHRSTLEEIDVGGIFLRGDWKVTLAVLRWKCNLKRCRLMEEYASGDIGPEVTAYVLGGPWTSRMVQDHGIWPHH